MDPSRDFIIKEFLLDCKKECSRINIQYFNCIEAKSLVADYLFTNVKDIYILSEETMKNISESCDKEYNFTECNEFQIKEKQ